MPLEQGADARASAENGPAPPSRSRYRIAVDTGGTFSDFIIFDEKLGTYRIMKVPSTPDDPGRAVLDGLAMLEADDICADSIGVFCHGTTVATNALLEERGARTGLAITEGFRGIYETMEQSRPFGRAIFDLSYQKPSLLAPQSRTVEITERIAANGEVRTEFDEWSVERAIDVLEQEDVEAVAVCFLFSFANPAHERRVVELLKSRHPEWWVTASSDLLPQIREYPRLSTAVVNAYVSPVVGRYVRRLADELDRRGVAMGRRFTMQSNGGSVPFDRSADKAVSSILSGPSGGVTAGIALARASGMDNIITFDMGGTSCDVALIQHGEPVITDKSKVAERLVAVPMLDINTVSAGGGTIASVDAHGGLQVGPESAGAVPGPAAYGMGGTVATVTDADVVLGYLNPKFLLDGKLNVDSNAAQNVIRTQVADPLGLEVLRAADGIVRVVNVKMAEAIKAISAERGFDLRDFTLVAFGGAGPVHAPQLALDLGIPRVLVPPVPGANSALGLLMSDVKHDYVRSRLDVVSTLDPSVANEILAELERAAIEQLHEEGFEADRIRLRRFLDMRYAGQGYENPVPVHEAPLTGSDLAVCRSRFDQIHKDCHGHAAPGQQVEVVNYRVEAIGLLPRVEVAGLGKAVVPIEEAHIGSRPVLFSSVSSVPLDVPIYAREKLREGHRFTGPAIVEQYDATTVLCPEQTVVVNASGNLLVTVRGGGN